MIELAIKSLEELKISFKNYIELYRYQLKIVTHILHYSTIESLSSLGYIFTF